MDYDTLDRWCERGILGLVLGMLLFMPLAFGGAPQPAAGCFLDTMLMDPFLVAELLILPALVLWAIRLWTNPRPRLLWPPMCWAVLAFGLYAIGRYLTADIEYVARQEAIKVLVYVLLFFLIINNLHRQDSTQIISFSLIALGMVISGVAVWQFVTNSDRVWHVFKPYQHRGSGTYICPNHLGGFLEMLLPIGIAYTLIGRTKPVAKVLLGYASLAMLAGLCVTVSRGSWIACAMALVILFSLLLRHPSYRLSAAVMLVIMLVFGVVAGPKMITFRARLRDMFAGGRINDDLRFTMWEPAMHVWNENIVWGAGPGHFDFRYRKYRPEELQLQPDRAHNDFLNTLADWGAAGLVLIWGACLCLGVGTIKTWRFVTRNPGDFGSKRGSNKLAFLLGASAGLIAIFIHSAVDFNMHIPANALIAVALMAGLSGMLRFASERYWVTVPVWGKGLATLVLVAGVVYLGDQARRHAAENDWIAKAQRAPDYSTDQIGLLQKALDADPKNFETAYGIGEAYRTQSLEGGENYRELAARAMSWYQVCMNLNPWDGYPYLRYGWCLDWTDHSPQARPYFDKAEQLDPNGYFTMAFIGQHYVWLQDYAAAKPWLERSLMLQSVSNEVASSYLAIVRRKMLEEATNDITIKLDSAEK